MKLSDLREGAEEVTPVQLDRRKPANITQAIDELVLAWMNRTDGPEIKQRRMNARLQLETMIKQLQQQTNVTPQ